MAPSTHCRRNGVDPNKTATVDPKDLAHDAGEGMRLPGKLNKANAGISDPTDPPRNPITNEPMTEVPETPIEEGAVTSETFGQLGGDVPQTEPTAIEIREINYQKMMNKGMSAAERAHLEQVRSADIERLRNAPPQFWNSIEDPQTRAALEALRDARP